MISTGQLHSWTIVHANVILPVSNSWVILWCTTRIISACHNVLTLSAWAKFNYQCHCPQHMQLYIIHIFHYLSSNLGLENKRESILVYLSSVSPVHHTSLISSNNMNLSTRCSMFFLSFPWPPGSRLLFVFAVVVPKGASTVPVSKPVASSSSIKAPAALVRSCFKPVATSPLAFSVPASCTVYSNRKKLNRFSL